ncbi:MAG: S41 family peptidase [Alphaproteobacteria bacterium]
MSALISRFVRAIPFLVLAAGGCTQYAVIDGPSETYAQAPATRMFATSYRFIDSQYIQSVAIGDIAADGLRALPELDPSLALNVDGGRIQLASSGAILADFAAPAPNDVSGWANVTVDLIDAGRLASETLRATSPEALYEQILDDAISSLDRYTRYASAADAAQDRADREGFGGVGITISATTDEGVDVLAVLPGTPAELAGVQVADRIVAVDGESVIGLNVRDVVNRLRGPIGSQVMLTLHRGGNAGRVQTVPVSRAYIIAPTVLTETEGSIAVLKLASFNVQTTQDVEQAVIGAYARSGGNLTGLILDLRNNSGGLLDQSIAVADLFLNSGLISTTEGRHPESRQRFVAYDGDLMAGKPIVVLVNGNTASAAEVLVAALQDLGRVVVVGSTSFGKGVVQTVNRLPNDGELTLTWSALHAPSGYIFHQIGIRPNVCTSGYGSAQAALRDANDHAASIASAMRRWRTHRLLELDEQATLLRAECEPENDLDDIDMEVARAILADPGLYAALLNLAPRDFAAAPQG